MVVENTDIPLISKVIIDNTVYDEYSYNDANLIGEEKNKFHFTRHHYNEKNQLVSTDLYWDNAIFSSSYEVLQTALQRTEWVNPDNTEKSGYNTFVYNNRGQLIKTENHRSINSFYGYSEFNYDDQNRISRQIFYRENKASGYIDYQYDENGNLIKRMQYQVPTTGPAELSTTTEYEYDNYHNPFKSFKRLMVPGVNTNTNNIIKETYTLHFEVDASIQKVTITETSYTYNEGGYPVTKNGNIEYVYK